MGEKAGPVTLEGGGPLDDNAEVVNREDNDGVFLLGVKYEEG